MRQALRILGFAGAAAAAAVGVAAGYLYTRKPVVVTPSPVRVEMTPARIARGAYLYRLANCDGCHSERDFSRFAGPVVEGGRGKGFVFPREAGLPGVVAAPNITPDLKTGLGTWTDGEKIRAIRDGVSRDGRPLFPLMGYERFRRMSDEDVSSLVAYLKTLAPVENPLPRTRLSFPESLRIRTAPQPAGSVPPPEDADRLKRGEYLATIAGCAECHSTPRGRPFAGGAEFTFAGMRVVSANISPDLQTGIGRWSEMYFLERFYQYKEYLDRGSPPAAPGSFTVMPWLNYAELPPEDLKAIYTFLRSQPAVPNAVDTHPDPPPAYGNTRRAGLP